MNVCRHCSGDVNVHVNIKSRTALIHNRIRHIIFLAYFDNCGFTTSCCTRKVIDMIWGQMNTVFRDELSGNAHVLYSCTNINVI